MAEQLLEWKFSLHEQEFLDQHEEMACGTSVRRLFDSIKHVVGRVMDEENAGLTRFFRKQSNGGAIDRGCEAFFLLRLIDRRVGSCIHDDVRFYAANKAWQQFGLR